MFMSIRKLLMDWAKREEEIEASLDLEWRIFAQAHNAAGKRPRCMYKGMELNEGDKAVVYEFPEGDPGAPPDILNEIYRKQQEKVKR